jgi:hypothetical protein
MAAAAILQNGVGPSVICFLDSKVVLILCTKIDQYLIINRWGTALQWFMQPKHAKLG